MKTAIDFFPAEEPSRSVPWVAYFFTSTALVQVSNLLKGNDALFFPHSLSTSTNARPRVPKTQGTGNFLWVPLAIKFGRRPVYVISYAVYLAAALWLVFERRFAGFLLGRILLGLGSGAAETLVSPLVVFYSPF